MAVAEDHSTVAENLTADLGNLSALGEAQRALSDTETQAASAIQEKEEELARVFSEMAAVGDEGRFAESKWRRTEIAGL